MKTKRLFTDLFIRKKEKQKIKNCMHWDLLRKDLEPTGYVRRFTRVAAIVPACHLPLLNKWCAAGFCRASLRLSRGGLLRPISCRERAVRGRSTAAQFWAAQLNNELKAITRLCEAERSTVEGGGGRGGRRRWVTLWVCDYEGWTFSHRRTVQSSCCRTTRRVTLKGFLIVSGLSCVFWGGVFCSFIVQERPSRLHLQMANRFLFGLCIQHLFDLQWCTSMLGSTPHQEVATRPSYVQGHTRHVQRVKKSRSFHTEAVLKTAPQSPVGAL